MCSPKFWTILIQIDQLRAIFTLKLCPSGPLSYKPFNILFWNITYLFVTSVPWVQPSLGKLELKIQDLEHYLRNYEFFWKVICVRKALPKFSIVSKSVLCLCSCSLVKHIFCGGCYCLSDILVGFGIQAAAAIFFSIFNNSEILFV